MGTGSVSVSVSVSVCLFVRPSVCLSLSRLYLSLSVRLCLCLSCFLAAGPWAASARIRETGSRSWRSPHALSGSKVVSVKHCLGR